MQVEKQGFDHVEICVESIAKYRPMYESMGFIRTAERIDPTEGSRSEVYSQGLVRIIFTEPYEKKVFAETLTGKFHARHGDGVCVLAVEVEDAAQVMPELINRGARVAMPIQTAEGPGGSVTYGEIFTPADLRYRIISRKQEREGWDQPALLTWGLFLPKLQEDSPQNIIMIDHLTNNVGMGEMKTWVDFYKNIFEFIVSRRFEIKSGRTGLISDVVQSPDFKIKVPINEATEPESQVQEFYDRFHGPGVQHLAFLTTDIVKTVEHLREQSMEFLAVPSTYYDDVPRRVPAHKEDLKRLEKLEVLIDGDAQGYLLQLFTKETMGPFFFEFIERKGNRGFGEGNFQALFEAIERDQIRRGVLTP